MEPLLERQTSTPSPSPSLSAIRSPTLRSLASIPQLLLRSASLSQHEPATKSPRNDAFAWGWALNGQLGVEIEAVSGFAALGGNVSSPTKIPRLCVENIVQVCCGSRCTFALNDRGMVFSFGRCDDGQLGHDELSSGHSSVPRVIERLLSHRISHIACRNSHVLAVSDAKEVWSWGRGDEGQLGHGDTLSLLVPKRVSGFVGTAVRTAAAGRQHSVVVSEQGHVFVFGSSPEGQLGLGQSEHVLVPVRLQCEGMGAVVDVSCGSRHTIVLTDKGDVYVWGWNAFGQLGLNSFTNVFEPTRLPLPFAASRITCGFRQSFAADENGIWWGWGWNQYRQLGHTESHGLNHSCSVPRECSLVNALDRVSVLASGGRHTLVLTASGGVYSFGRGSDGQLGQGNIQDRDSPTLVQGLGSRCATAVGCGWAHSLAVAKPMDEGALAEDKGTQRLVTRGDLDAFFGVFFNLIISLLLITSLCKNVVGMSDEFVASHILPGAGYSLSLGSLVFGLQARAKGGNTTSLPFGLDTPILLSTVFLVMGPVYAQHGDYKQAYRVGLFSALVIGTLQIMGAFVGDWIRKNVPRPALLSALAGIGIGFIAEGFLFQVYSDPVIAIVPMILIWVAYASGITLPLGLPGSMAAVIFGTVVAFIAWGAGYNFWKPFQNHVDSTPHPGRFAFSEIGEALSSSDCWNQMPLIVPLCVINIVGSLVNLEGAASVGDQFPTRGSMVSTGLCTVVGAVLGCPFPCCIFMGHAAWKAVGARYGYSFLCAIAVFCFCVFNGITALTQIMPMDSTVGILLWVGLAVTAQAFEGVPHEKPHHLAVAVGILPAVASWAQQTVANYLALAGSSFYAIQGIEKNSLFMQGMISFSQGFLLLSVLLATLMVNICDRKFDRAAVVSFVLCGCSFFGFVHAFELQPTQVKPVLKPLAAPHETVAYLFGTVVLLGLHIGGYGEDEFNLPTALASIPESFSRWRRHSLAHAHTHTDASKKLSRVAVDVDVKGGTSTARGV